MPQPRSTKAGTPDRRYALGLAARRVAETRGVLSTAVAVLLMAVLGGLMRWFAMLLLG